MPPSISLRHMGVPRVSVAASVSPTCAPSYARARSASTRRVRGADRMTVAVTLFALLELYKRGEAGWEQPESFGDIAVRAATPAQEQARVAVAAAPGGRAG